ncbi:hypothetical protein BH09BAC2_BH09BAC2_20680 [soil metagenome]
MKKIVWLTVIATIGFFSNSFSQQKIKVTNEKIVQKGKNGRSVQTPTSSIDVNDNVKIKNKNGKFKSKTPDGKIKNTADKVKVKTKTDSTATPAVNRYNRGYDRSNEMMSDSGRMHNNRDSAWMHRRNMNDNMNNRRDSMGRNRPDSVQIIR